MADQIKPALTPEEWASPLREVEGAADVELLDDATRHRNAAICLEGHPAGFTQEDVTLLLGKADDSAAAEARACLSLADRIAALLRPG